LRYQLVFVVLIQVEDEGLGQLAIPGAIVAALREREQDNGGERIAGYLC